MQSQTQWDSFLRKWSGIILRILDAEQANSELKGKVPEPWIKLLTLPNSKTISELWSLSITSLPKFTNYLSWAILDARIAVSEFGYFLVYKLMDWNEHINFYGNEEIYFEDGFMISGLPIDHETIDEFQENMGLLPLSLRNLWLTHGFIEVRGYGFLASLDLQQQRLVGCPQLINNLGDEYREGQLLDCLSIINLNSEPIISLSRPINTTTWLDYIVNVNPANNKTYDATKIHLDDLLSDWLFTEWQNH